MNDEKYNIEDIRRYVKRFYNGCISNDTISEIANDIVETKKAPFPQYVTMPLGGACMRLIRDTNYGFIYYVDGGRWDVEIRVKDGKLYSSSNMKGIHDIPLISVTEDQWRKANGPYAPDKPAVYGYLLEDALKIPLQEPKNEYKYLLIKR